MFPGHDNTPGARGGILRAGLAFRPARPLIVFSSLVQLITGRRPAQVSSGGFREPAAAFPPERRSPRVERFILLCWILIAIKHVAILWAAHNHPVPFDPLWVNLPTWLLGALATGVYYGRARRR